MNIKLYSCLLILPFNFLILISWQFSSFLLEVQGTFFLLLKWQFLSRGVLHLCHYTAEFHHTQVLEVTLFGDQVSGMFKGIQGTADCISCSDADGDFCVHSNVMRIEKRHTMWRSLFNGDTLTLYGTQSTYTDQVNEIWRWWASIWTWPCVSEWRVQLSPIYAEIVWSTSGVNSMRHPGEKILIWNSKVISQACSSLSLPSLTVF